MAQEVIWQGSSSFSIESAALHSGDLLVFVLFFRSISIFVNNEGDGLLGMLRPNSAAQLWLRPRELSRGGTIPVVNEALSLGNQKRGHGLGATLKNKH